MAQGTVDYTAASFNKFLKQGKLMGIRCTVCETLSAVPRPLCPACHSTNVEWYEFSGQGSLTTFTCISIGPANMVAKGYGRNNPYCSGIVTLQEGPRISARILNVDASKPQDIKSGTPLKLSLGDMDQDHPALAFEPI